MREITERVTPIGSDLSMKLSFLGSHVNALQLPTGRVKMIVMTPPSLHPVILVLSREEQAALGEYLVRKANSEPRT
jgi:hypothetical protein